jgi:hypothetical protein
MTSQHIDWPQLEVLEAARVRSRRQLQFVLMTRCVSAYFTSNRSSQIIWDDRQALPVV